MIHYLLIQLGKVGKKGGLSQFICGKAIPNCMALININQGK